MAAGDKSGTFPQDTNYTEIRANSQTSRITVWENARANTQQFYVKKWSSVANPVTYDYGGIAEFVPPGGRKYFFPGELAGLVATVAGSITMAWLED